MLNSPLISVVMPSYNHADFIKSAIHSVLQQTFADFELIIIDDCSTDNSVESIKTIKDKRIRIFAFEKNQGACTAINYGISKARGKYIAIINSDDLWHEDKLKLQLEIFKSNPRLGAIFTHAHFIKQTGEEFAEEERPYFYHIFHQPNRSRFDWLQKLFFDGNCLCHPSVLIKKTCYKKIGLYDNRFRQLPDYDMWIRLVKKFSIHVLEKELVYFRLLDGKNTSAPNPENSVRDINERCLIASKFFNNISPIDFKKAFMPGIKPRRFGSRKKLEIEKTLIYLRPTGSPVLDKVHMVIGLQKLYNKLGDSAYGRLLAEQYHQDEKTFQKLMSQLQIFVTFP